MFSTVIDLHIHTRNCGGSDEISNKEGAENSDWKGEKCNACMNKAQEGNKFGVVAGETMFSTVIDLQILEFVVAVMEHLGNPDNGGFDCLFSSILEFKVLFSQPTSYKDELGENFVCCSLYDFFKILMEV